MPERLVAHWSDKTHIPPRYMRPVVRTVRHAKLGAYALLVAAGIASMIPSMQPATLRSAAVSPLQIYAWGFVLTVSAALCLYGAARDCWWGEYIGLLPLFLLSVVYAVSAILQGDGGIPRGCFLFALALFCLTGWADKAYVRAAAAQDAQRRHDRPPLGGHSEPA